MASDDLGLAHPPAQAAEGLSDRYIEGFEAGGRIERERADFLEAELAVARQELTEAKIAIGWARNAGLEEAANVSAALSAEAAATIAAAQKPELMPIDSAPKDGTRFLAYERGRHFDCWWHYYAADQGYGWRDDADSEPDPTYWMPLPSSPEDQQKTAATPTIADPDGESGR